MSLSVVYIKESKVKQNVKRIALFEDFKYITDLKREFINAHNQKINRIKKPAVTAAG